ncbi:MAG: LytTR family transcriptional regulator DNA-binding domain-containing protein, partial [Verrucomicrobiales bacterium]
RQGISTLLAVPVFHRGRLMMQIGFDTIGRKESWERWEIDRLRKAGRLIFSRWMMDSAGVLEDFDQGDWASRKVQIENAARHENLSVQEITRISALGDYSRVVFANGREVADSRSLKHWESELLGQDYLRISRSLIVRISLIESLDRRGGAWKLKLENFPDWFPVGRPYRAALRHHLDF